MSKPINLHIESIWLQGAIRLLLELESRNAINFKCAKGKDNDIYNEFIIKELKNRESMLSFLYGKTFRFSEHSKNIKGKLISIKVTLE